MNPGEWFDILILVDGFVGNAQSDIRINGRLAGLSHIGDPGYLFSQRWPYVLLFTGSYLWMFSYEISLLLGPSLAASFARNWWYWLIVPQLTAIIGLACAIHFFRRIRFLRSGRNPDRLAMPPGVVVRRSSRPSRTGGYDRPSPVNGISHQPKPSAFARGPKRKGALMGGLYDAPIWKDWLAYWTVYSLFVGITPLLSSNLFNFDPPYGFLFVVSIWFPLQFFLFGFVPTSVRRWLRRRRAGISAGGVRSTADPS
jgi:hypothetical protein